MFFPINLHFSVERWKRNDEYGVYVSSLGRVKLIKNNQLLFPKVNDKGYINVFTDKGMMLVHRLVMLTFEPNHSPTEDTVDHINSNKRDNSLRNLRWCSQSVNQAYATYVREANTLDAEYLTTKGEVSGLTLEEIKDMDSWERMAIKLLNEEKAYITCNHILGNFTDWRKLRDAVSNLKGVNAPIDIERFKRKVLHAAWSHNEYCGCTWSIKQGKI